MKNLKKLSLIQKGSKEFSSKEMLKLRGGDDCCGCGCNGPSSDYDNQNANWDSGYGQSSGGAEYCYDNSGGWPIPADNC